MRPPGNSPEIEALLAEIAQQRRGRLRAIRARRREIAELIHPVSAMEAIEMSTSLARVLVRRPSLVH